MCSVVSRAMKKQHFNYITKFFADQPLPPKPHIAVLSSNKVGNFVVITPLLRGLKEKYSDCILDFFGSETTKDFEVYCPYIDWRFSLHERHSNVLDALRKTILKRQEIAGDYALLINCDGFSEINLVCATEIRTYYIAGNVLLPDFFYSQNSNEYSIQFLLKDRDWDSPALLQKYRDVLDSNYISEIFCRICFVDNDFFKLEIPWHEASFSVPDILIHVTTTRPAKMWPVDYWKEVIWWCEKQKFSIGLIGSSSQIQQTLYNSDNIESNLLKTTTLIDLRGKTTLTELAGALRRAKACISIDSGPLHIAAAVDCPTIAIFGNDENGDGASPMRLWAPRQANIRLALSDFTCNACRENYFKNHSCFFENHPCMLHVYPKTVINHLENLLGIQCNSTSS